MADTDTRMPNPANQELEEDAKQLASIAPGTTFVYQYCSKQERELENVPQLNIFGLEPRDWTHRLVGPIFNHDSVTRYEVFSAPRNRQLKAAAGPKTAENTATKKKSESETAEDVEENKPADDVEMKEEEEKVAEEEPPKKKIGHVRFWFKEGADDSRDVFLNLMKLKFKIPNRSILIRSQVAPSPSMTKQDLDTILDGFGATESERSINGRRLCFKDIPADLTEEVVRESLPDIENIEFKEDAEKTKCCIITLPTPDRALIVLKEKRGTKGFGGEKPLRVNCMRYLNTETLVRLKNRNQFTKPDLKNRKRGAATAARGSTRGGGRSEPDRKRKPYGNFSNGSMGNRSSAWGIRTAPFSSGIMARSVGGFGGGGILDDYRPGGGSFGGSMSGGFSSGMGYGESMMGGGGASGYGAPPTLGGRSGGGGGGMRSGMGGVMNGMGGSGGGNRSMMTDGGSGYGMGITGSRSSAFGNSGRW